MFCRVIGKEGMIDQQVLSEGAGKVQFNTGSVLPEVESVLRSLKPGETLSRNMLLPLNGPNPFSAIAGQCTVELTADERAPQAALPAKQNPGKTVNGQPANPSPSLFEPSMSKQVISSSHALPIRTISPS